MLSYVLFRSGCNLDFLRIIKMADKRCLTTFLSLTASYMVSFFFIGLPKIIHQRRPLLTCCWYFTMHLVNQQWLATVQWFSLGPPVSSTIKTDHHNITEILLKVALITIKQTNVNQQWLCCSHRISTCTYEIQIKVNWI